jgi:hypothetical protein
MTRMRWSNLSAPPDDDSLLDRAAPAAPPLPLALPGATVRTFDTPGFSGMTFFEIRAKSIINKVPGASRVPFEWTINPYRGCSHACAYCLSGDTPILMADGATRPLSQLQVGDAVMGTMGAGPHRRYVPTTVLDHWSTSKLAFRVTLADGTRLVSSGDHRFLTARGWRYVRPAESWQAALAIGDVLCGVGHFAEPPKESPDYRAGFLAVTPPALRAAPGRATRGSARTPTSRTSRCTRRCAGPSCRPAVGIAAFWPARSAPPARPTGSASCSPAATGCTWPGSPTR